MTKTNEIIADVTKQIKAIIRANDKDIDLNAPFYAINWFSTKIEWMYHFYNFLATRSVLKIGAKPFFKGHITSTYLDEKNTERQLILIVKYPGGQQFKQLMEDTWFKIVSIFRILSVKQFTFAFTKKISSENTSELSQNFSYAVHHFKTNEEIEVIFSKLTASKDNSISIKYAGGAIAQLYSQQIPKTAEAIPILMDGIVIFEATSEIALKEMFDSLDYQQFISSLDSSYIGFLKRIL